MADGTRRLALAVIALALRDAIRVDGSRRQRDRAVSFLTTDSDALHLWTSIAGFNPHAFRARAQQLFTGRGGNKRRFVVRRALAALGRASSPRSGAAEDDVHARRQAVADALIFSARVTAFTTAFAASDDAGSRSIAPST